MATTQATADRADARDPRNYVFGETLRQWMLDAVMDIHQYVAGEPFQRMYRELESLATFEEKDEFVRTVLLRPDELERRGLTPPAGVIIQRSAFGDKRATVFCVVKYLPDGVRKATMTFDHKG